MGNRRQQGPTGRKKAQNAHAALRRRKFFAKIPAFVLPLIKKKIKGDTFLSVFGIFKSLEFVFM
jgi:hypothetical protein